MRQPDWATADGRVKLYLGDCLDVIRQMQDDSAAIAVTSPPYNMIPKTAPSGILAEHSHKKNKGYASHDDDMPQEQYEEWIDAVARECARVCRGVVWVNHKAKFIDRIARHPLRYISLPLFCEIIWDRGVSLTLNANRFAPSHESILGFGVPHTWDRCCDMEMTVWRLRPVYGVDHPCPFPVEIPERLIRASSDRDEIVVEPFMGSGTTGVACVRLGRQFIGIEKEPRYFDIAVKRIKAELERAPLFEERPKYVTKSLFSS